MMTFPLKANRGPHKVTEKIMHPLKQLRGVARWLMAAGLSIGIGVAALPRPASADHHGEPSFEFTKAGEQFGCDYVRFKFRFSLDTGGGAINIADITDPVLNFRDRLPAGLSWVSASIEGDVTGPGVGAIPAHSITTDVNTDDKLSWTGLHLSAIDVDGDGSALNFTITAVAKIDKAVFPAPAEIENQATMSFNSPLIGGGIVIPSHQHGVPDDGNMETGEPTKVWIDVTDCDGDPGGGPGTDPDAPCFTVEGGDIECDPLGGGNFIYKMQVGPEMAGKTI
ncbi:MAG: hypothetical protein V3V97_00820, partial [Hyphomicrobiaceae bacterium]